MAALAVRERISIVGGNISRSPGPIVIDMTATGSVHRRRVLSRAGARAGDDLYVTGALGGAATGLKQLRDDPASDGPAVTRYRRPEPRTRFGVLLARNRAAHACIDLSDGLGDGLRQIRDASGLGAVIDADAVPLEGGSTLQDALSGGEDYELLFAASARMRSRLEHVRRHVKDVPVTRIGRLTTDRALILVRAGGSEELPPGFTHF
jgi:thiamine-monophosphate kinase